MFAINDKDLKRLERELTTFKAKALPFATKATLNSAAFKARSYAQDNIREKMITRNQFAVKSVQVEQTQTLNIRRQASAVGSIAGFMETQEFGGSVNKKGQQGVPIATSYSAGLGMNAKPRTKLPRKPNQLANIQLKRGRRGANRKQRNLVAIKQAAASGDKYVYLDLGRRKGIFKVVGGKRKPSIRMVYDLTNPSVTIKRNPWLKPASDKAEADLPGLYERALVFQLKRHNIFND